MRRVLAAFSGCLLLLLGVGTASAAPPQPATLDEVLAALEVRRQPSDYVIVVDTSLSMREEDRYPTVIESLGSTLSALQPDDHVALITFDDGARVAYRGDLGADPQAVLGSLPASPSGTQTDIGAGLDLGVEELEREDANEVGALVLVTDGELDTRASSDFAEPTSPGWEALQLRANELAGREIATYALSLDEATDAGLMADVFPEVKLVPVGEFAELLSDLDNELLGFQARQRLESDLANGKLTAQFGNASPLGRGAHETSLQITSLYEFIPTYVTNLAAERVGSAPASVDGLPAELTIPPGETVEFPVTVTVGDWSGSSSQLSLAGSVATPWGDVLAQLRTPFAATLESQPLEVADVPQATVTPSPEPEAAVPEEPSPLAGLNWALIGLVAGGALVVALLLAIAVRKRPVLDGSLTVMRDGRVVQELLLTGSTTQLVPPGGEGPRGSIAAMAWRSSRVFVKAQVGDEKARARLGDGERVQLDDYTLIYTAKRSRVLEMMG